MSVSYPRVLVANAPTGAQLDLPVIDAGFGRDALVVFQIVGNDSWNGSVRTLMRINGADRSTVANVPFLQCAHTDELTKQEKNNTTDITTAGIYSVHAHGAEVMLRILNTGSTGTVTILAHSVDG